MRRHSGFGWLELAVGILLVALGILVFLYPDATLNTMIIGYGLAALVTGISDLILFIQLERYTGFGPILALISGIFSVMAGAVLMLRPRAGVLVLTVLFPIWFVAHCISRLARLGDIRFIAGEGTYRFTLVVHTIGLILGLLMFLSPVFTLTTIRYLASIYLILLGIDGIVLALSRLGR